MIRYLKKHIISWLLEGMIVASLVVSMLQGLEITRETPLLFGVLVTSVMLIVFLLSRSTGGIIVLFVSGMATFFVLVLLGYTHYLSCFIGFLVSSSTLFFMKKQPSLQQAALGGSLSVIALVVGCVCFVTLIKPLNPPSYEMALISVMKDMELSKKLGIYSSLHVYDETLKIEHEVAQTWQTEGEVVQDLSSIAPQLDTEMQNQLPEELVDQPESEHKAMAISYNRTRLIWLEILLGSLLVVGVMLGGKKIQRVWWLHRLSSKQEDEQVSALYHYYLKGFKRMGYGKKEEQTVYEYMLQMERQLRGFALETGDFNRITDIYVKSHYGNIPIGREEYQFCYLFFKQFRKMCKVQFGATKYYLNYFVL